VDLTSKEHGDTGQTRENEVYIPTIKTANCVLCVTVCRFYQGVLYCHKVTHFHSAHFNVF